MANCIKCGAPLREGAKFCGACGTKIEVRRFCTQCGTELEPGENFCTQCGAPAEEGAALQTLAAPSEFQEFDLFFGPAPEGSDQVEDCDGGCRILKYANPEGAMIIPSWIYGKQVVEIGPFAFYNCPNLTEISIPNSVTKIGASAFACCASLTYISIPGSVAEIGEDAFDGCNKLIILAPAGSAAERYADNHHITVWH